MRFLYEVLISPLVLLLEFFFKLVRDSFKFKRKTIKNNLKNYDIKKLEDVLNDNGFTLESRAETIPVEVFIQISNALS